MCTGSTNSINGLALFQQHGGDSRDIDARQLPFDQVLLVYDRDKVVTAAENPSLVSKVCSKPSLTKHSSRYVEMQSTQVTMV